MMMGLGSYGYGGPSSTSSAPSLSSSSNLSALAPPFTVVDRFSSKPGSNSAVQYPELPYTPSFGPPWQSYGRSLAQKPAEMEVDSTTRITSVPLPDDYSFQYPATMSNDLSQSFTWSGLSPSSKTSSGTFLFDGDFGKMDSYYKPYVPSMVDHDSSLVSHSEPGYDLLSSTGVGSADLSSQADYTHNLHGLEYHAPFHATWNGAFDGKLGKQAEASAPSFLDNATAVGFSTYKNPVVQGNASRGQFSSVIARENSSGFSRMERKENMSHSVQSVISNPLDSSRATISGPSFTVQLAQPPGSSVYQTTSYSGSVSVTKPSPALVIRPPPSSSATVTLKSPYGNTPNTANDAAFHPSEGLGKHNPLKGKESHILRNSEDEERSAFTSQLKRQRDGNSQLFSAMGDAPNQSNGSKVKLESPVRIIDATNGSSLSFDMGPDCLDHHTYAVDSPCWKGAPGSSFSPFDDVETESTHQFGSKIDKYGQMDLQHQTFPPPIDLVRSSSAKAGEDKLHAERGVSANPGNNSEADCTVREQSISAVKTVWKGSNLMSSRGVQFSEDFDVPKHLSNEKESKSSGVASTSDLSFRGVAMGSVLNLGDTTEGDVAVRAAETVLSSPSSEDCVSEVAKSYETQSPPKMDVPALVKTLHGVSDMLLFSCLNDSYALKDQEVEMIKQAIANLNKLSSKMDRFTESKDAPRLQQDTCDRVGETPNIHANHPASKHKSENEESNKAHDCVSSVSRLGTDYVTLEKAGIFQSLDSPTGDLDVLGDGTMSQAIKKVLEENFPCEKEMESQAQLFKNLWLDAEAKLCSISYRVRFERMKAEMQKFKANLAKESGAAKEKTPGNVSEAESDSIPKPMNLSSTCQANDVEASVMSRFDTLKLRDDLPSQEADKDATKNLAVGPDGGTNQGQTDSDDVEASVMNRFRILKCRDDQEGKVDPIYSYMMPFLKGSGEDARLNRNVEPHYSQTTGNNVSQEPVFGHSDGPTYEVVKDFFPAIPAVEVKWSNVPRIQYSLRSSGNSSSDWEHVMKEEAWRFA